MDLNFFKLRAGHTGKDISALIIAAGSLTTAQSWKERRFLQDEKAVDAQTTNEPAQYSPAITASAHTANETEEFERLTRAEESHTGSLAESLLQMYSLVEKARRESLTKHDKLKTACANMFEITKKIPAHPEQAEQEESIRETGTSHTSLGMLAQMRKAGEDLEAFVQNSSSFVDSWVDIEQSFERIISAIKPDGSNPLETRSPPEKVNVNLNQRNFDDTVACGDSLGERLTEQLESKARARGGEPENDKKMAYAKREKQDQTEGANKQAINKRPKPSFSLQATINSMDRRHTT